MKHTLIRDGGCLFACCVHGSIVSYICSGNSGRLYKAFGDRCISSLASVYIYIYEKNRHVFDSRWSWLRLATGEGREQGSMASLPKGKFEGE